MVSNPEKPKLLLFGGTGIIGQAICKKFEDVGWTVVVVARKHDENFRQTIEWNPCKPNVTEKIIEDLRQYRGFDAVCWAQGANLNDDVFTYQAVSHMEMYSVNVAYILNSLSLLLQHNLVKKPAKFCVLSSIWQDISRQNKLSYAVTKSALKGLVLSACNDMARDGHLINAVLPGALDTPMTRANLTSEQVSSIENATQFNRLAKLEDVSNAVFSLCSDLNTGITGNFITVDLGFSHVRNI